MMDSNVAFVLSGTALGLSAGLSPGPLLALVISETMKHGILNGVKVSMAPLMTDLPIVCVAVFLLSQLTDIKPLLGVISLFGAVFLVYLGWESMVFKGVEPGLAPEKPKSIRKGVAANFLNPSPYLFWFSIGGPMVIKAAAIDVRPAALFVSCFYAMLVGSKVLIAFVVGTSGRFLKSVHYVYTVRFLGIALWVFAAVFIWDGLRYLGIANGWVSG